MSSNFIFLAFEKKTVLLKVAHYWKLYQHTTFHAPTFAGAVLHPPQKSEIMEWLKVQY
jgi:hypothetical protein